jgi:hypothetical protein
MLARFAGLRRRFDGSRLRFTPGLVVANPFEVYLVALVILGGVAILAGALFPVTLAALVSRLWVLLWGAELVAGGALTLLGLVRNRSAWRVVGLKTLAWASLAYTVAIVVQLAAGPGGAGLGFIAGFAAACYMQARHVTRTARLLNGTAHRVNGYETRLANGGPKP